ncbi:MAG: hypothetical protein HPY50_20570 [Firmicutes bacterium]|nr:hypothetical protein [Bacillota bacterium]
MNTVNIVIVAVTILISLLILAFIVDWRYFNEWVVVYLFKSMLDLLLDNIAVSHHLLGYPQRLLPQYFQSNLLFDFFVFPVVCIWYNQVTREKKLAGIILYAFLFSAVMTAVEFPIERWTELLDYVRWTSFTTFYTLFVAFLVSRGFMAFYRWGSRRFGNIRPL